MHIYIDQLLSILHFIALKCFKNVADKNIKSLIFKLILCINILVWYRYIKLLCKFMFWWQYILKYTQATMCGIVGFKVAGSVLSKFVNVGYIRIKFEISQVVLMLIR